MLFGNPDLGGLCARWRLSPFSIRHSETDEVVSPTLGAGDVTFATISL